MGDMTFIKKFLINFCPAKVMLLKMASRRPESFSKSTCQMATEEFSEFIFLQETTV